MKFKYVSLNIQSHKVHKLEEKHVSMSSRSLATIAGQVQTVAFMSERPLLSHQQGEKAIDDDQPINVESSPRRRIVE